MNTITNLSSAIDSLLDGDVDSAIMRLLRLRHELVSEALQPAPKEESLPPIQYPNGKKLKSRDIPCPTCKAKAGQDCWRLTSRGPHGKPTDVPMRDAKSGKASFHKARYDQAKEANS